jgi:fermentation-respiration switch protein FrsA (DUF1100 family)
MNGDIAGWSSVGALVASLLSGPVEWLKNTLTFHPNPYVHLTPAEYGLPYEEVWFGGTDGRRLHGWYVPSQGGVVEEAAVLFIWFHGNAGNIAHRLAQLQLLHARVGGSHFLFDYRGYGKSQGRPTVSGLIQDGYDAMTIARLRGWTVGKAVVYFGESLGCAVLLALAVEQPPDRVILSAPFASLRAMGQIRLPPLAFLVENDFNNARLVTQLRAPLLVIHGTDDRTVPFRQGQELYALAPHPKLFYPVIGGGHTNLHEIGGESYLQLLRDFVFSTPENSGIS